MHGQLRGGVPVVIELALLGAVVGTLIARPLGQRFADWLERRENEALARDLAEADVHWERFDNDPEYALAYVRDFMARYPEFRDDEMLRGLEQRAAKAGAAR